MFSSRIISFFLLFISFGMFAAASPVAITEDLSSDLIARGGTCNYGGCNEVALLNVLVDLKVKIDAHVLLLDGHKSPYDTCNNIIADINAAVVVIADIDVDISGAHGAHYHEIVIIIAAILNGIIGGCHKYGLLLILAISVKINICLGAFLTACGGLIPGLLTLVGTLIIDVQACISLGLVLVVNLCGLHL